MKDIIYEDQEWIVINKPIGISTHGAYPGDIGVVEWFQLHHNMKLYTCSRLDQGTGGLLLFGKTPQAAAIGTGIHNDEASLKTYLLISDKRSHQEEFTCYDQLDQKDAKTSFTRVKSSNGYTLYRAEIARGRKHQIRRHAAALGIPIVGDSLYGGEAGDRLYLHCGVLNWPGIDQILSLMAPNSFNLLLDGEDPSIAALCEKREPFLSAVTDSFRMIQRGELGPFVIDKYGDYMLITGFDEEQSGEALLEEFRFDIDYLMESYGLIGGALQKQMRDPHNNKLFTEFIPFGEEIPEQFIVRENGLKYNISLNQTQHTGLFLDQRDSRRRVAQLAKGKRVANLFSFTCSFSAVAAAAEAEVVFSIDLAKSALERGKGNFELNDLTKTNRGKFIAEDVRKWLAREGRKREKQGAEYRSWDLVICDPPVFASGKGGRFTLKNEWPGLVSGVRHILSKGGKALFANNHRGGDGPFYLATLKEHFKTVTEINPPIDFPRIKGTIDVRIYLCEG